MKMDEKNWNRGREIIREMQTNNEFISEHDLQLINSVN